MRSDSSGRRWISAVKWLLPTQITCVGWSADGARFASGATDGKVRLHDRSGRLLHSWLRLGGPVQSVAFAGVGLAWTAGGAPGEPERRGELGLP